MQTVLANVMWEFPVHCVQNYGHSNLFCDDMDCELMPTGKQAGVGVLNASPLHMGLLSDKPVPDWHPAPEEVRDAAMDIRALCRSFKIDPAMLAVRCAMDHTPAASTFVGMAGVMEVHQAVESLEIAIPEALLHGVCAILSPVENIVCSSSLHENQDQRAANREVAHASH